MQIGARRWTGVCCRMKWVALRAWRALDERSWAGSHAESPRRPPSESPIVRVAHRPSRPPSESPIVRRAIMSCIDETWRFRRAPPRRRRDVAAMTCVRCADSSRVAQCKHVKACRSLLSQTDRRLSVQCDCVRGDGAARLPYPRRIAGFSAARRARCNTRMQVDVRLESAAGDQSGFTAVARLDKPSRSIIRRARGMKHAECAAGGARRGALTRAI